MKFFIPPTLVKDFKDFLQSDLPGAIFDYEILHSWYDQFKEDYKPVTQRAEIYPDATKSRYADTDNNLNIRFAYDSEIVKGDYIIEGGTGTVYLLDWDIPPEPNNKSSRALRCNVKLTFQRYQKAITDKWGYLVQEEGMTTIAEEIPANAYRYEGRPEFSAIQGTPGIAANALSVISVQLNEQTQNLRVDDEFLWGNEIYTVIDVGRVGVNIDGTHGVLSIQARKKAGGLVE